MADVAMPRLSDSMEEGTILKWLKSDGDQVKRGEELVEIETDKANMTYEADQDGVLKIVAQEGDTLPVGQTIASIGEAAAQDGGGDGAAPAAAQPAQPAEQAQPAAQAPAPEPPAQPAEPQAQPVAQAPAPEPPAQPAEPQAQPVAQAPAPERQAQPAAEQAQPATQQPQPAPQPQAAPAAPAPEPSTRRPDEGEADGNGRVKASPVARRMAREMGLELARLEGSGPGGRIVKADVEAAAKGGAAQAAAPAARVEAPAPAPAAPAAPAEEKKEEREVPAPVVSGEGQTGKGEVSVEDLSRLQQTIARRMAESKATAPEFVLNVDVDMDDAVALRKQLKAAAGDQPAPSFNDFVIKAAALALGEFPRANGAYRDGKFELYSRINVGVAVAGQDALVVPTVFDADQKSLGQIAKDARALAERVRAGAITPPELSSGTFTVSNLGMFGIDSFVAVINPPQAAILAVGALKPTPVVRDGEVTVRSIMRLTLVCDHRILYGADAAQFLSRIRERLEQPLLLVL